MWKVLQWYNSFKLQGQDPEPYSPSPAEALDQMTSTGPLYDSNYQLLFFFISLLL